jgi:hypothetical protein
MYKKKQQNFANPNGLNLNRYQQSSAESRMVNPDNSIAWNGEWSGEDACSVAEKGYLLPWLERRVDPMLFCGR